MKNDKLLLQVLLATVFGYVVACFESWLGTSTISDFLIGNLITILVALLAINSATLSIVLTKIREIIDKSNLPNKAFSNSKSQMMLSIKEQIVLIFITVILMTLHNANFIIVYKLSMYLNSILIGVFIFSIMILYDTAKSVFIILEF